MIVVIIAFIVILIIKDNLAKSKLARQLCPGKKLSLNGCYYEMGKGHSAKEVHEFFLKTRRCIFFAASLIDGPNEFRMVEWYDCGWDNTFWIFYDEKGITNGIDRPAFAGDAHTSYSYDQMRFYLAALDDDLKTVRELIGRGIDINKKTVVGQTALHYANMNGHADVIGELIKAGADVHAGLGIDRPGWSPIFYAASYGNADAVQALIKAGADVNIVDIEGKSPIFYAAESGNVEIIELLIKKGAKVDLADKEGKSPLMAALENLQLEAAHVLRDTSSAIDKGTEDTIATVELAIAASKGDINKAQALISDGINVNSKWPPYRSKPILHYAVENNQAAMVKLLLASGVEADAWDANQWTALMLAAANGNEDIVKELIANGADINAQVDSKSAISLAVNSNIINILKNAGAKYLEHPSKR
ncbi:MAG: hypothetical protein A2Y62_07945 [Candidatus Fischerbacteria bacterium RBG_13_37_8]|uniref:Uncharacterized protein n=1 Tax=Candidatus Fischerbacteria bacterium RBG_13_37_8 TaxID=1817863 RepID=A0A1F5V590_9BACT|nr:MAG: hypothetical protein A2Y62_07945 [Candidatus Fischerbacteria bacterium RBG_13_37_8]